MKIAITSEILQDLDGQAGERRKIWVYEIECCRLISRSHVDLPAEHIGRHSQVGAGYPLEGVRLLIAGGIAPDLKRRLKHQGVFAVATAETDPDRAVAAFFSGTLQILPSATIHRHVGQRRMDRTMVSSPSGSQVGAAF